MLVFAMLFSLASTALAGYVQPKHKNGYFYAALGDSVAAGFGMTDRENYSAMGGFDAWDNYLPTETVHESYPAVFAAELLEEPEEPIEVVDVPVTNEPGEPIEVVGEPEETIDEDDLALTVGETAELKAAIALQNIPTVYRLTFKTNGGSAIKDVFAPRSTAIHLNTFVPEKEISPVPEPDSERGESGYRYFRKT